MVREVATIEQINAQRVAARNERLARMAKSADQGWEKVDLDAHRFSLPKLSENLSFAAVDRSRTTTLLDIFLAILTPDILTATWEAFPPEYWCYGSGVHKGTFNGGKLSLKFVYAFFAVYIFIVGEQNAPKEGARSKKPLLAAITRAVTHFRSLSPNKQIPSFSLLSRFWGRFYIPTEVWPSICQNFQNLLTRPGRCLAGDEKLLHFTGDSAYIRLVPSKPDRIGLWFFQLVVILEGGYPYLVHTRFCNSSTESGESIPVNTVVKEWAKVVKYFVETKKSEPPVLIFDSYYTDNEGRNYLNQNNVKFIGAVMTSRFRNLMDNLIEHGDMVEKPGQTASIFNSQTNELFVHHWDVLTAVGKKYVISNAFERVPATRANTGIVPAYDQYKGLFNACDKFNRNLHDRKYCHRAGGNVRSGENGHTFKFLMASILQNTLNAFKSRLPDQSYDLTFAQMCYFLSQEIMAHSFTCM